MSVRRQVVYFLSAALVFAHILVLAFSENTSGGSLASNAIELASGVLAMAACLLVSLRSHGYLRRFWFLASLAMLLWVQGQAHWIYLDNVLHQTVSGPNSWAIVLFFFPAPLLIALVLDETQEFQAVDWVAVFDLLQIVLTIVIACIYLFYTPEQANGIGAGKLTGIVYDTRNLLMLVVFSLRYLLTPRPQLRAVYGRLAIFFLLYALGGAFYYRHTAEYLVLSGRWYDLTWSIPFAALAVMAVSEIGPQTPLPATPAWTRIQGTDQARKVVPILMPVFGITLCWQLAGALPNLSLALLLIGFVIFAGRLITSERSHQRALQAFRESETKFQSVAEMATAAIMIYRDGRILYANPALADLTGYRVEELVGLEVWNLVPPGSQEAMKDLVKRREGRGPDQPPAKYEYLMHTRRGEGRWVEITTAFIQYDGAPAVLGVAFDITSREQSAQKLRESLSLLKATLESTADGILVVGLDRKVTAVNQRFLEMFGFEEKQMFHSSDQDSLQWAMQHIKDPEAFLQRVEQYYSNPSLEGSDVFEFSGGRTFERYSRPQWVEERIVGRVWSFREVTQRRLLESQLRQSQKMEAVGNLAGGVAHDFNNLLTVIKGYCQLLEEQLADRTELLSELGQISSASDKAATLTKQLLAFSRRQVLQMLPVNLNVLVTGVEKMLTRVIGEQIHLITELDPSLGYIEADPGQIEQVVLNLAVNARDAMPAGGTVTFRTENLTVANGGTGPMAAGEYVRLTVTDTGEGMDAETASHVFEPFFTTKEHGTGLGLSMVYGIVQQCHGTISLESTPGAGTRFHLVFPRVEKLGPRVGEASRHAMESSGTESVFVVEDNPGVREFCHRVLESHGYKVTPCSTAVEALDLVRHSSQPLDLLLTDLVMPDMRGERLAAEVTQRHPACRVLFMSGYPRDQVGSALKPDAAAVLAKPFSPAELLQGVRDALSGRPN